jgi:hypothetical protein
LETKGKHQTNHSTLSQKGYDHMVGENTDIVDKGIQPHTTHSLFDSDKWSITEKIIRLKNQGFMWKYVIIMA